MKKNLSIIALGAIVALTSSCGSSKQVANNDYYNNPQPTVTKQDVPQVQSREERKTLEVQKLAAAPTDKIRVVGMGQSKNEKIAHRMAMIDAQQTIANRIEAAVIGVVEEYFNDMTSEEKSMVEASVEGYAKTAFGQKLGLRTIGVPQIFDNADGSVTVYTCFETAPTKEELLKKAYDGLSQEKQFQLKDDRENFVEKGKDVLDKMSEQVGL